MQVIKDPVTGGLTNVFGPSEDETKAAAEEARHKVEQIDEQAEAAREETKHLIEQAAQKAYEEGLRQGAARAALNTSGEALTGVEMQAAEREAFRATASSADVTQPGYFPDDDDPDGTPPFSRPMAGDVVTVPDASDSPDFTTPPPADEDDDDEGEPGDPGTGNPDVVAVVGDRAARILAQAGYNTLAQLDAAEDTQLQAIDKIGPTTVEKIRTRQK